MTRRARLQLFRVDQESRKRRAGLPLISSASLALRASPNRKLTRLVSHQAIRASRAKLNGLNPEAYLAYAIDQLARGHLASRLAELLPWNCKDAFEARTG